MNLKKKKTFRNFFKNHNVVFLILCDAYYCRTMYLYPQIIYHTAENYTIMRRLLLRRFDFRDYKHVKIFIRYAFTLLYNYIYIY